MKTNYKIKMEIFNNNETTSYLLAETYLGDDVNYERASHALHKNTDAVYSCIDKSEPLIINLDGETSGCFKAKMVLSSDFMKKSLITFKLIQIKDESF